MRGRALTLRCMLAAVLTAALAACASTQEKIAETAAVRVQDDSFLPYREFTTGVLQGGDSLTWTQGLSQKLLAARVDRKTGAAEFFLQFNLVYVNDAKRGYESVRNAKAQLLKLVSIKSRKSRCSRKSDSCIVNETLQIFLPEQDLRQVTQGGYPVKLFARSGPHVQIDIPKAWIDSILAKVDADNRGTVAATATAQPAVQSAAAR